MPKRGRPPTPDVLTPREWEVLGLLRDGLSNREIAERLGISLSGAKYHVSEIISKLGVSSREEAAGLKGGQRHWGVLPASLGVKLGLWPAGLPLKVAGGVAAIAVLGFAALGLTDDPADGPDAGISDIVPLPATELPCSTPVDTQSFCRPIIHIQLASWDEAQPLAGWTILEPGYIPADYERDRLTYSYVDGFDEETPRMATVSAKYLSRGGANLIVSQGYWLTLSTDAYYRAPEEHRGQLTIGGRDVFWINGSAVWEQRADGSHETDRWDENSLKRYRLVWVEKGDRPADLALEKAPDGTVTFHPLADTLTYAISATDLPLEELIKVAESMLQD